MLVAIINENGVYGIASENRTFIPFEDQTYDFESIKFIESSAIYRKPISLEYGCSVIVNGKIERWNAELKARCDKKDLRPTIVDSVIVVNGKYKKKIEVVNNPSWLMLAMIKIFRMAEIICTILSVIVVILHGTSELPNFMMLLTTYFYIRYVDVFRLKQQISGYDFSMIFPIIVVISLIFVSKSVLIIAWAVLLTLYMLLKLCCIVFKYNNAYERLVKPAKNFRY